MAKAWQARGILGERHVVAVIGDGALTGGMAWEALNNIATSDLPIVIVVNDNERSYSPTIGGVAHHLATLRTAGGYERVMSFGKRTLQRTPVIGRPVFGALHGMKKGIKDIIAPQGLFEDLGLKYIGPIDGHDEQELEFALERARDFRGPVIVHAMTVKGKGYAPAEQDEADRLHGVGIIDPDTGKPLTPGGPTWTSVFADELVRIGHERRDVVAITAAMLGPTGLSTFAEVFPDRIFDVGIAEQHAATSAAGMAYGGLHPVVALYATFLNRAFDQVLMDCALHRAGVTFVLDRAGVTGDDGPSHNGMWDMAFLGVVPGLRLAAPRDESRLREALHAAVDIDDGPSVIRFPKGKLGPEIPAVEQRGGCDVLRAVERPDVLIVALGAFAALGLDVAERLTAQGIGVDVVDPIWALPVTADLVTMARSYPFVVTLEDGVIEGGIGSAIAARLAQRPGPAVMNFGIPREFLAQGKRAEVLQACGLTAQDIARVVVERVSLEVPVSDETVQVLGD